MLNRYFNISIKLWNFWKFRNFLQLTCGEQCNEWRHWHLKACPWVCLGTAMNRRGDGRAQRRSERNTRQTRGRKRLPNDDDNIIVTNNESSTPPAPPTSTQQLSQEKKNDADVAVHHNSASLVSWHLWYYFIMLCIQLQFYYIIIILLLYFFMSSVFLHCLDVSSFLICYTS
jgi:hypothetical protein